MYDVIVVCDTHIQFQMFCACISNTHVERVFPIGLLNAYFFILTGYEEIRWTKQNQTEV